ncbi:hypothetical protein U1Q18_007735, partial [Sarracenia purpurea var. burkii]
GAAMESGGEQVTTPELISFSSPTTWSRLIAGERIDLQKQKIRRKARRSNRGIGFSERFRMICFQNLQCRAKEEDAQ